MNNEFKSLIQSALDTFTVIQKRDGDGNEYSQLRFSFDAKGTSHDSAPVYEGCVLQGLDAEFVEKNSRLFLQKILEYDNLTDFAADMRSIIHSISDEEFQEADLVNLGNKLIESLSITLSENEKLAIKENSRVSTT